MNSEIPSAAYITFSFPLRKGYPISIQNFRKICSSVKFTEQNFHFPIFCQNLYGRVHQVGQKAKISAIQLLWRLFLARYKFCPSPVTEATVVAMTRDRRKKNCSKVN
jgi:hypothetical protein